MFDGFLQIIYTHFNTLLFYIFIRTRFKTEIWWRYKYYMNIIHYKWWFKTVIWIVCQFNRWQPWSYGAVAYICQEINSVIETKFLCSKTDVASLPKSSSRLELLSSFYAVKLGKAIKNAMTDRVWTTTYWSNSKVVLSWIKGNSSQNPTGFRSELVETLS